MDKKRQGEVLDAYLLCMYDEENRYFMSGWEQVLALILGNAAVILPLFIWIRTESRADSRHLDTKLDSNRELIREVHSESMKLHYSLIQETKEFHSRLCILEERYLKILEKR